MGGGGGGGGEEGGKGRPSYMKSPSYTKKTMNLSFYWRLNIQPMWKCYCIESQWPPGLPLLNFSHKIIYIPSLGVKAQSDAHYSNKKI